MLGKSPEDARYDTPSCQITLGCVLSHLCAASQTSNQSDSIALVSLKQGLSQSQINSTQTHWATGAVGLTNVRRTYFALRVDEVHSVFVDGDQQDFWVMWLCCLLKKHRRFLKNWSKLNLLTLTGFVHLYTNNSLYANQYTQYSSIVTLETYNFPPEYQSMFLWNVQTPL